MNYSNLNCQGAYEHGLTSRKLEIQKYGPVNSSTSILIDFHYDLKELQRELRKIGDYKRGDISLRYGFIHCTSSDTAIYAKAAASHTAYELGHDFEGILSGLIGDGVPIPVIEEINKMVTKAMPGLIKHAEEARIETKYQWKAVSLRLGTGKRELDVFIADSISLLESVLDLIVTSNPTMPSGYIKGYIEEKLR
jgi:hypothetical protein